MASSLCRDLPGTKHLSGAGLARSRPSVCQGCGGHLWRPLGPDVRWGRCPAGQGGDPGIATLLGPVFCNGYANGSVRGYTYTGHARRLSVLCHRSLHRGSPELRSLGCAGSSPWRAQTCRVPEMGLGRCRLVELCCKTGVLCVPWGCSHLKEPPKQGIAMLKPSLCHCMVLFLFTMHSGSAQHNNCTWMAAGVFSFLFGELP